MVRPTGNDHRHRCDYGALWRSSNRNAMPVTRLVWVSELWRKVTSTNAWTSYSWSLSLLKLLQSCLTAWYNHLKQDCHVKLTWGVCIAIRYCGFCAITAYTLCMAVSNCRSRTPHVTNIAAPLPDTKASHDHICRFRLWTSPFVRLLYIIIFRCSVSDNAALKEFYAFSSATKTCTFRHCS